ncbi:signal peptidase I [Scopulibacillus darangshiensis]|uniref:Signal peptidase I n=1 Tax=Scopulibacillus darangshiensis TaxID=442528 RepID=A0A4R2P3J0_9BACL|nr:signal peptidase I [Scopulibacillus darangshiensis]TCP29167.1 signal peptidase I [Scopulibacillus darangshiensis]
MAKQHKSLGILKPLIIAVVLAVLIRYFIFGHIVVDGHSMMPTLHDHDHMIVNKLSYDIGKPHRFDIVIFHATKESDYIKRVIGLPGETIKYENDTLYVDGQKVDEPFLDDKKRSVKGWLTYNFIAEVPQGTVFVMGDNRRNSRDSRIIGPIPLTKITGKAEVTFWPFSDFQVVK